MKGKLSALKYVRNNKKQVGILISVIALTFTVMYVVNAVLMCTVESFKVVFLEQPKKTAYVELTLESMGLVKDESLTNEMYLERRAEIVEELKDQEGIDGAYYTSVLSARYEGIIGETRFLFPLLEKDQIQSYLDHMDARLIEGRMPENEGEVIIDSRIMKNNKLKTGDLFDEDLFGDSYIITGVLESDSFACVGIPNNSNNGIYYTVFCDENNCDMKKLFSDIGIELTSLDSIIDINTQAEFYEIECKSVINTALTAIIIVVMIFLAISVLVAYISSMRSRMNEYCLYTSIGFSRSEVYGMIMREILFDFISGMLFGTILTVILMFILKTTVTEPVGLILKAFYPRQLLKITASFAAIIEILQIPIIVIINSIKTIDRIEE